MRDKYTDTIRIGIVSAIFPERGTAKVTFPDRDDIVSRELPVMVPCTLEDKWYYMPDVGERVRCLFDPEAPSRGLIMGSYYDDTRVPPFGNKNKAYVFFKDKTLIEYDRELHLLTVHIPSKGDRSVGVFTADDIEVESLEAINATSIDGLRQFRVHDEAQGRPDAGKVSIKIKTVGNDGTISLVTTNTINEIDTFDIKINGQEGWIEMQTMNHEEDKPVVHYKFDGQRGDIDATARNFTTDNRTIHLNVDGQEGLIALTTFDKNTEAVTGIFTLP